MSDIVLYGYNLDSFPIYIKSSSSLITATKNSKSNISTDLVYNRKERTPKNLHANEISGRIIKFNKNDDDRFMADILVCWLSTFGNNQSKQMIISSGTTAKVKNINDIISWSHREAENNILILSKGNIEIKGCICIFRPCTVMSTILPVWWGCNLTGYWEH